MSQQILEQILREVKELKAGQQEMSTELHGMKVDQHEMRAEQQEMKAEQQERRAEQRGMRTEQKEMRLEQQNMIAEQSSMRKELTTINKRLDNIESSQQMIYNHTATLSESQTEILSRMEHLATKEDLEYFDKKSSEHEREIFKIKQRSKKETGSK